MIGSNLKRGKREKKVTCVFWSCLKVRILVEGTTINVQFNFRLINSNSLNWLNGLTFQHFHMTSKNCRCLGLISQPPAKKQFIHRRPLGTCIFHFFFFFTLKEKKKHSHLKVVLPSKFNKVPWSIVPHPHTGDSHRLTGSLTIVHKPQDRSTWSYTCTQCTSVLIHRHGSRASLTFFFP